MEKRKIDRINELARLSKTVGLTQEQLKEREVLRREYIEEFRAATRATLDNTFIQRPDGSKERLGRKDEK